MPGGLVAVWWLLALVSPILVAALLGPLNARCRLGGRHSTRLAAQRLSWDRSARLRRTPAALSHEPHYGGTTSAAKAR